MNKAAVRHPVVSSIIVILLFLAANIAGSLLIFLCPPDLIDSSSFVPQFVAESVMCLAGIALVAIFGYSKIWSRTENFGKGLISGIYIIAAACLSALGGLSLKLYEGVSEDMEIIEFPEAQPLWLIGVFLLTFILVGIAEECFFRGVIANLFWDKHAKDPAGVWTATIYAGLIFGLMHTINLAASEPVGVFVQVIGAISMGMAFTAIYYRCKNIWVTIFIHAFLDICAMLPEGIFGGSISDEINSYTPIMAVTASVPYIVLTFVLLRKKKLVEMFVGEGGFKNAPNPNGVIYTADGPAVFRYEIRSSQKSRASLARIAAVTIVIVVMLFACILSTSGEMNRVIADVTGEHTLDYTHSGEWNGERTFGSETIFEVGYSGTHIAAIKALPSENNAYVLIQIKRGEEIVFQENYGGRCDTEVKINLEKGEYSLILVYNFSEVTNPEAEYYTEVVIE